MKDLIWDIAKSGEETLENTELQSIEEPKELFIARGVSLEAKDSTYKINKFTPGSGIKIKKETQSLANYSALILPWNITKYLLKKKYFKNIKYTSIAKITRNIKR